MSIERRWVGLDVGELTANICVFGSEEEPELELSTGSSPSEIREALSAFSMDSICDVVLESGAEQGLARSLKNLGFPVTLLDAGKAQKFLALRSNKTDQNDAHGLADIARLGRSKQLSVWVRSAECELIRSELVMREQLVKQRAAIRCCLRAQLKRLGSRLKKVALGKQFRSVAEEEFQTLAGTAPRMAMAQLKPMLEVSETLSKFIEGADRRIKRFASSNPVTRRFLEIPGVGPICAVSFAISRAGNKMTRGHLFMSAGVMLSRAKKQCAIGDWGSACSAPWLQTCSHGRG